MKGALLFFVIVAGLILFAANFSLGIFEEVFFGGEEQEKAGGDVLEEQATKDLSLHKVEQEVSAPPPLRASKEQPSSQLTKDGVFGWTNIQRADNALPFLAANVLLDTVALAKLSDMFEKEYFDHVSPSGMGVGDLAEIYGYEFIAVGENLALGNYSDDQDLVQAWMDSPGHRANILNDRYEEIGIAVGKGLFEGRTTWLAVQSFGRPLSSCTFPDEGLQGDIESSKVQLDAWEVTLDQMRANIRKTGPKKYNELVGKYNALIGEVEIMIAQYNAQVREFNECASG
jgi:uncharacterized protein YkwD